jgi:hypothetical protein
MSGVAIIAAGTRIHGGDKHEGSRIVNAVFSATDGDMTVFKRLAHYFEHTTIELW